MRAAPAIKPAANDLAQAAAALAAGQLVVIPTDTVYGLAARPDQTEAIEALFAAKQRPRQSALPLLVANQDQAAQLVRLDRANRALLDQFWPGPLTLVALRRPELAWDLGGSGYSLAIRQPDHLATLDLLALTGPLAVSSANLSGQAAATTVEQARAQLGGAVDFYLDAGPSPGEVPSTVVRLEAGRVHVLRPGALARADIADYLHRRGLAG